MDQSSRIAIVGIGGVFSRSLTLADYWDNIVNARDTSCDVPAGRWPIDAADVFDPSGPRFDHVYSLRGYFIEDFAFDADGFGVPAPLLRALDPVFHLVLHAGRAAWDDAVTSNIDPRRAGVVMGNIILPTDRSTALAEEIIGRTLDESVLGRKYSGQRSQLEWATALPSTVLGAALGLGAGTLALDAACASSLFAIKLAVNELLAGRTDVMLAGGVSRPDCLYTQMGFSQLRALSPNGICRPFDRRGDGLVVGEGAGFVVLKRLPDAIRDGDKIYAVLCGIGLSNDTRGNVLAPDRAGQVRALRQAYQMAGWTPDLVDLIECHGTGTPVGDKVELESLHSLWQEAKAASNRCAIGSVKSTIGHTLTAAGAAGLLKLLLAMQHQMLPPTANCDEPREELASRSGRFRLLQQAEPWPRRDPRAPRRAAISAFGFGGTNAHLLLEEWQPLQQGVIAPGRPLPPALDGPIAMVAMESHFGNWGTLAELMQHIRDPDPSADHADPPTAHWWGVEQSAWFAQERFTPISGNYLSRIDVLKGEIHLPPRDLEEMLPQQLLMLIVAARAIRRCRLEENTRMRTGVFIGAGLDLNTTNFHLRWSMVQRSQQWAESLNIATSADESQQWLKTVQDAISPPLSAGRTLGALASITASRIAREFTLGGPSFVVCADDGSGLAALDKGVQLLQNGEIDCAIVGAVELCSDVRSALAWQARKQDSSFKLADGAVAFVLKRLADAKRDGDRIVAIVHGIDRPAARRAASIGSSERSLEKAETTARPDGRPAAELVADGDSSWQPSFNAVDECIGYTGAAHGIAKLLLAVAALHDDADGKMHPAPKAHPVILQYAAMDGNRYTVRLEAGTHDEAVPAAIGHDEQSPESIARTVIASVSVGKGCIKVRVPVQQPPVQQVSSNGIASTGSVDGTASNIMAMRAAVTEAHAAYLRFSKQAHKVFAACAGLHVEEDDGNDGGDDRFDVPHSPESTVDPQAMRATLPQPPRFEREQCLEFAVGSIASVLGPDYAQVDQFPTRVRLPDEPYLFVDRIVELQGQPRSLTSGRIVTEHDVIARAWYLDGNRIPAGFAIEAGQADLFLSAYLGIDFHTRGLAKYRLLDAAVTFHRPLPGPGDIVRYEIHIDRFFRQGSTILFRFRFVGSIDGEPVLTMTDGCAGFFTEEELASGKGIIEPALGIGSHTFVDRTWQHLVNLGKAESLDAAGLAALRQGDLGKCFGPEFAGLPVERPLTIPGGRLHLIDRIVHLDPCGGPSGLGVIRSEQDIAPDAWFLTCHFVDDPVMPGTLMYECCLHTLRVFLLRIGWIAEADNAVFEPAPGVCSRLKCRGQVIGSTHTASYEITIKKLGYNPAPFAIADAMMYADGKPIVKITDISLQLTGATRQSLEELWQNRPHAVQPPRSAPSKPLYDRNHILEFARGYPSKAFGEKYRPFDRDRTMARLPGPPFSFIDRIIAVEAEQWTLHKGSTARTEYDVPRDAWYFQDNRQPTMPFFIVQEIALQSCGWLAAYQGSALTSEHDLRFRNLGGRACQRRAVSPIDGTLTTSVCMTDFSKSGDMLILHFAFVVENAGQSVYEGETYFGFFTSQALAQQLGIRTDQLYQPTTNDWKHGKRLPIFDHSPFPAAKLRMIRDIELYSTTGGPHGKGIVIGSTDVDPDAWFFQCHFFQDPVWPGSLGLESLLQLLKMAAYQRFGGNVHTWFEAPALDTEHRWTYRGQIVPSNARVTVQAAIREVDEHRRYLVADGWLSVDGLLIYQMTNFAIRMHDEDSGDVGSNLLFRP